MTTLKMQVSVKQEWGTGDLRYASLCLTPDYSAGANKEWADNTPSADLRFVVKGVIGDEFALGDKVTVSLNTEKAPASAETE
jgi:hypothetical protein